MVKSNMKMKKKHEDPHAEANAAIQEEINTEVVLIKSQFTCSEKFFLP